MAIPFGKFSFISGEISPSLYGHVDNAAFVHGASTMRNAWVNYRGGAASRPGTKFVGFSKQTGRNVAPRVIDFQFSINQGLCLEFGNFYMRVVSNGAFVTETQVPITGITQSNPGVITVSASGSTAAAANDGGVVQSYAPGDLVTLAGGSFSAPAVLSITTTKLLGLGIANIGRGYTVSDTITLNGGVFTTASQVTVASLVNVPAIGHITFAVNPSASDTITLGGVSWTFVTGTPTGNQTQIGVNLAATLASLAANLNGSGNATINECTYGATSTVLNITFLTSGTAGNTFTVAASAATPSGATLSGGGMTGVGTVNISNAGAFTSNPSGAIFTQGSTSGSGTGANFNTALMGPLVVAISSAGTYSVLPTNPVSQASTTGTGLGATFTVTWGTVTSFSDDDWLFLEGISGMTELNGRTVVIGASVGTNEYPIFDVFGNSIDTTGFPAYTGGGTAARIFTLTTPYAEADLLWLKVTQSADVMTIGCWNQQTGASYPAFDLERFADDSWTLTDPTFAATIDPPQNVSGSTSSSGATQYAYCVTTVSNADGSESVASNIAFISESVDIGSTLGTITINWNTVIGNSNYNVYKAEEATDSDVPVGASFGFVGSAFGTQFVDSNITPDFDTVPPVHKNPFAPGQAINVVALTQGSGYTEATVTINSIDGSGAAYQAIIIGGAVVAYLGQDNGGNYQSGDTVTVTGDGGGATASLTVGPESGTFPSVPTYFQERRIYAATPNNPDTYFMSQPGAFLNFDSRIPTIDTDAIIGSPWSLQVDGIQFMVPMPGGLVVLTGSAAWQIGGTGSSSLSPQAITPSSQQAQSQAFNGCSANVAPIRIDYQILYLQAKGSIFREFTYNIYANIYTGNDLTVLSGHLFTGFTILASAYCEEPYKIIWAPRNDGVMLSLTYLLAQEVRGWARHDTQGSFLSVCSVTEPPVDALYMATQRYPGTESAYMIERFDNRLWPTAEDVWCVDAGLQLTPSELDATLTASSPTGLGALIGVSNLIGGTGYSAFTQAIIVDNNGKGKGTDAVASLTIVAGVITAVIFISEGAGYSYPTISFYDPTGGGIGASATPILNNTMTFSASEPVFSIANVGSKIRMGGGVALVIGFISNTQLTGNILVPITRTIPGLSPATAFPAAPGSWTLGEPVSVIGGLQHLIGATVTGVADGDVIAPQTVAPDGTITLDTPASLVTVGLGFEVQIQTDYLETGNPTIQGQRKKIGGVTSRVNASSAFTVGGTQEDGGALSPMQVDVEWFDMQTAPDMAMKAPNSDFMPLYTGDIRLPVLKGFDRRGQVAVQQLLPLPLELLAVVPEILPGDTPSAQFPQKDKRGGDNRDNG